MKISQRDGMVTSLDDPSAVGRDGDGSGPIPGDPNSYFVRRSFPVGGLGVGRSESRVARKHRKLLEAIEHIRRTRERAQDGWNDQGGRQ